MTNLYFSLAIYAALAIALGFGIWLYFSVRRQIAALRRELTGSSQGIVDSTARTRILGMAAKGDQPQSIAAALHLPLNEVELTLKLATLAQS